MRETVFGICENKDADQLRGNREADFAIRIEQSLNTLNPNFNALTIFCDCTDRFVMFVSDLVGNPEDRFSHNEAHLFPGCLIL